MFAKLFGFGKKKEEPVPVTPVVVRKEHVESKPVKKVEKPKKTKYICNSCGYRFTRASHIETNGICPYCGKTSAVVDETADAQKLIDTTAEAEEEFSYRRR